jgi:hypothetical protein
VDPRQEYTARRDARRGVAGSLHRLHIRLGNARLLLAVAAAALASLALKERAIDLYWLLLPAGAFAALAIYHDGVLRRKAEAQRAAGFYQAGIDRLDGNWAGRGEPGDRFSSRAHPYAEDLDIFGRGSLFELLCRARTRSGEETLAAWLLASAAAPEIRRRQQAIDELRSSLDLREDLALLGEAVRAGVHAEPLARWSEQPLLLDFPAARVAAGALAAVTLSTLAYWAASGGRIPFLLAASLAGIFGLAFRQRVRQVMAVVDEPAHDLALLAAVLARVERETFHSEPMRDLRRRLEIAGAPPSRRIARLNRLMDLIDSRDNVAVRIFGPLALWSTQLAFAVEAWRKRTGPAVRDWLAAIGEIEALSSLAGYAFEHPADPYPVFVESGALFDGRRIGHPLLPESRAVRNSVRLATAEPLLVVSGSNMSGKSTLLRTVGVNAVLAMAGAPVRAEALHMSSLALGASIRVIDSLQEGSSRFYAEIRRLRALVEIASGKLPLLFLLDELLHGTNSHDRLIGGAAVVRGLVARNAIGLITTHDLALAGIADSVQPPGANVHFEDHLENGVVTFDYLLRPGVVRKSNALELMRSIGIEV